MSIAIEFEDEFNAELSDAVLFYRARSGQVFATEHPVRDGEIQAGVALNTKRMAELLLNGSPIEPPQLIHERLLIQHPRLLAWWTPQGRRELHFNDGVKRVWLPPLFFAVRDEGKFHVFALPGNSRPTQGTRLLHAPVMNRYEKGDLCMGSMPKGKDIATWEASFFNSRFTHPHYTPRRGAAHFKAHRSYPLSKLEPAGLTVGQFVGAL